MGNDTTSLVCKACGTAGNDRYCSHCGQPLTVKRITLRSILHDVFHLFTHLDKGFAGTLKHLVVVPGAMQRMYISGDRARYQKPFSMFFICATLSALVRYWVFEALIKWYGTGSTTEAAFYHNYTVILQGVLLPVYTLIVYLLFKNSKYNYAESGVLMLYTVSMFFLLATAIVLLKFIWPRMDTAWVELPVMLIYNLITLVNFYNTSPKWVVLIKGIILFTLIFFLIQLTEDFLIRILSK